MKPNMKVVLLKVNTLLMNSGSVGDTPVKMKWNEEANDNEYGL